MTARITLVIGGDRSGKSRFALECALRCPPPRVYLATAPRSGDAEMADRIARHRRDRGEGWGTIEEGTNLAGALARAPSSAVVLVDCLTLWVSNLMMEATRTDRVLSEEAIESRAREVLAAARARDDATIFVTNEVGLGIVPENALARRFRDLAGRANQVFASGADEVHAVIAGLSVKLK